MEGCRSVWCTGSSRMCSAWQATSACHTTSCRNGEYSLNHTSPSPALSSCFCTHVSYMRFVPGSWSGQPCKSCSVLRRAPTTHQLLILALGDRVPALIILHVAVVAVVCAVADAPAMVGHQDGAVCDVAHLYTTRQQHHTATGSQHARVAAFKGYVCAAVQQLEVRPAPHWVFPCKPLSCQPHACR